MRPSSLAASAKHRTCCSRLGSALFISPHLDDAVFSCGGTAARLAGAGWRVGICTTFTASVPDPRGFALACQTDKGIPATRDYMALRRAEDSAACAALGAEAIHFSHPEAPHRGYESAPELFSGILSGDDINIDIEQDIDTLIRGFEPDLVFMPQGLGAHVDHVQVIRAVGGAVQGFPGLRSRLLHYRDTPYALRDPGARPVSSETAGMIETGVDVGKELPDKLRACSAYHSQLGFQFGGEESMRTLLEDFSFSEGRRLGIQRLMEAYLGTLEATGILRGTTSVEPARQRGEMS